MFLASSLRLLLVLSLLLAGSVVAQAQSKRTVAHRSLTGLGDPEPAEPRVQPAEEMASPARKPMITQVYQTGSNDSSPQPPYGTHDTKPVTPKPTQAGKSED